MNIGGQPSVSSEHRRRRLRYVRAGDRARPALQPRAALAPLRARGNRRGSWCSRRSRASFRFSPRSSPSRWASSTRCSGSSTSENEANLRTGITPSLIARYTTGQSLGAKAFYRMQLRQALERDQPSTRRRPTAARWWRRSRRPISRRRARRHRQRAPRLRAEPAHLRAEARHQRRCTARATISTGWRCGSGRWAPTCGW